MIVEYEAVDRKGQRVQDTIEVPDVRSAVESLRKRDLFVTSLTPQGEKRERKRKTTTAPAKPRHDPADLSHSDISNMRMSIKQVTMFTRQMAMLLNSGSGVVPALQSVGKQFTKPQHAEMVRRLTGELEEGQTFTDALRKYPNVFDTTYCAVIAAGEASGTMNEMFTRMAKVVGNRRVMRNKVIGATVYPALLICLSTGIIGVLMFFVMPRFSDMFRTLGVDLPFTTQILIDIATILETHWAMSTLIIVGGLAAIVALSVSNAGRKAAVAVMTRTPVVKQLVNGLILGETFRVLGMLLEARVGLLEAIDLVRGVTHQPRFQELYDDMENEITAGGSASTALGHCNIVPSYICHAVRTGEESGSLGTSMTYVADVLDEDNTELLNSVTKLFEPAILIVMGVVVGCIAISLFLPMFDVTAAVQ